MKALRTKYPDAMNHVVLFVVALLHMSRLSMFLHISLLQLSAQDANICVEIPGGKMLPISPQTTRTMLELLSSNHMSKTDRELTSISSCSHRRRCYIHQQ